MSIRDISGVFSRFFISGFFLPAFFSLFVLWLSASDEFLPNDFQSESKSTQVLVLGGVALLVGLIVLGLRHPIVQIFEGYRFRFWPLGPTLILLQQRARQRVANNKPESNVTKWRLDRLFPREEERLLPTRLGNVIRAAEDHAYIRWGLDHIAVWPRIDPLLSEREQELHSNARSDLHFFLNSVLGALFVGGCLIVDEALHDRLAGVALIVYVAPFGAAYLLYRMGIGAAEAWGLEMRASADIHRLELYGKLGIRRPSSPDDERRTLSPAINAFLLRGEPLPLSVWDNRTHKNEPEGSAMTEGHGGGESGGAASPGEPRELEALREASPGEPREPESPTEEEPEPAPGEPREGPSLPGEGEASPGEPRDDS